MKKKYQKTSVKEENDVLYADTKFHKNERNRIWKLVDERHKRMFSFVPIHVLLRLEFIFCRNSIFTIYLKVHEKYEINLNF